MAKILNIKEEKERIRTYRAFEQLDNTLEYTNNTANTVNKNRLCEELTLLIDKARPYIKKADKSEECEQLTTECSNKLLTLSMGNKNVPNDFFRQVEKVQEDASDDLSRYKKLFDFLADNADIWLDEILSAINKKDYDLLSNGAFYMFAYDSVINFEYLFRQ